ncbi:MAG TPA: hypothetical protein VGQ57_19860 [Polyangiaceae bacterium]|jgi:hypothetical protein|nr:hypothetical protein [Polyangiaceae bacterium]
MHRSAFIISLLLAVGLTTEPALARPPNGVFAAKKAGTSAKRNIAVGQFDGPKASKVRVALMMQIKDAGYSVTDAEDVKAASSKKQIAKMAKALEADALVLGKVSNNQDLTLSVYKADGRLIEQIKVKGGSSTKLQNAIQDEFDTVVAGPLAKAAGGKGVVAAASAAEEAPAEEDEEPPAQEKAPPPPPPAAEEPPPNEVPPDDEAPKEDEAKKPKKALPAAFEADLRFRVLQRSWDYTGHPYVRDPSTTHRTLEPYNLDFAPALDLAGIFYPGALFTDNAWAHIGITGSYTVMFATGTDFEQQIPGTNNKLVTKLKTSANAWDVGLRGRIPLGPVELAPFVTFGSQSFILHGDEGGATGLSPLVPDVQYWFVRPGAEIRVRLAKVLFGGHFAYRALTSLANIDLPNVWFPGASGYGLDYGFMLGYGVLPFMEVALNADFTGYGFDFNPLPTDPNLAPVVAGGATDRYKSLSLGVKFTLPSL